MVDKLGRGIQPGEEMVTTALRYVISHQTNPVAIPGPKSVAQAAMNAAAGNSVLSDETYNSVLRLLN